MALRRTPARGFDREEMVAYIHGIDPDGDVAHILVHKRGNRIRFSGRLGAHEVSPPNSAELERWVKEAEKVWGLNDTIGIPRGWMNMPETVEKIASMNVNAAKKKRDLEVSRLSQT
jgi:hypothetical protein